jgi:hypothetical protein
MREWAERIRERKVIANETAVREWRRGEAARQQRSPRRKRYLRPVPASHESPGAA